MQRANFVQCNTSMKYDKAHNQLYSLVRLNIEKSTVEVEKDLKSVFLDDYPTVRTMFRASVDLMYTLGDAARSVCL